MHYTPRDIHHALYALHYTLYTIYHAPYTIHQTHHHPLLSLQDYLRLTLRRDDIIRRLSEPYLKDYILHAYARLCIGERDGQRVYRMVQVLGVETTGRTDRLPATSSTPPISTSLRLTCRIGDQVRERQRISMLSNHTVSSQEFQFFHNKLPKGRAGGIGEGERLTKGQVRAKRAHWKQLNHYIYSHEEISHMVAAHRGLDKSATTDFSTAMELLQKRREEAVRERDYDALDAINKTVEALERGACSIVYVICMVYGAYCI